MSRPTVMVISLPQVEYQFLQELMTRVTREGLLIPDELPYAASIWTRIRQAQAITPPSPDDHEAQGPSTQEQPAGEEHPDA